MLHIRATLPIGNQGNLGTAGRGSHTGRPCLVYSSSTLYLASRFASSFMVRKAPHGRLQKDRDCRSLRAVRIRVAPQGPQASARRLRQLEVQVAVLEQAKEEEAAVFPDRAISFRRRGMSIIRTGRGRHLIALSVLVAASGCAEKIQVRTYPPGAMAR